MNEKYIEKLYQWRQFESCLIEKNILRNSDRNEKEKILEYIFKDMSENIQEQWKLTKIQNKWHEISGPLSQNSKPIGIKKNTLIVGVAKSVYAQELNLHSSDILLKIQTLFQFHFDSIKIEISRLSMASPETSAYKNFDKNNSVTTDKINRNLSKKVFVSENLPSENIEFLKKLKKI